MPGKNYPLYGLCTLMMCKHSLHGVWWFFFVLFLFFYSAYLSEGFLHLQSLIGTAIVEWKALQLNKSVDTDFSVEMQVQTHVD